MALANLVVPFLFNQPIRLRSANEANILIGFNATNGNNILTAIHFDDITLLTDRDVVNSWDDMSSIK